MRKLFNNKPYVVIHSIRDNKIEVIRRHLFSENKPSYEEILLSVPLHDKDNKVFVSQINDLKKILNQSEIVDLKKFYKRIKFELKKRTWEEVLSKKEVKWVKEQFARKLSSNDFDCCDNFRAAKIRSASQMRRFTKQRNEGCCGSYEWVALRWGIFSFPTKYLLGFNYGH